MDCVEIFLPLSKPGGAPVAASFFSDLEEELVARFGGITAFTRAPARGRWQEDDTVETDEVVVFEVMVTDLDRSWWGALRSRLETQLNQREVLIRRHVIERL